MLHYLKSVFLLFFIFPFYLNGQERSDSVIISFNTVVNDFGLVYEADGNLFVKFEFKNDGKQALKINKIYAPGLSTEKIPDDSVLTGKTSAIIFKFSPFGLAGNFNKKIRIFSNASNSPTDLVIKGKIASGSFSNKYKFSIGPVAFRQSQFNFGYLYKGEDAVRYNPIINSSGKPITLSFDSVPDFLSIIPAFDTLLPGKNSTIEVRFNTNECNDWDFFNQKIKIKVYSTDTVEGFLPITANIREDFSLLSEEEKLNKPVANIPVEVFNFDTIAAGQKVYYDFLVYNSGQRELKIWAVKPTCGCTAAMPEKTNIAPGDSTYIRVEFNSEGFSGENKKGVTIISNDPENYKQFLWVTGWVK
jgi:hypothetical protein